VVLIVGITRGIVINPTMRSTSKIKCSVLIGKHRRLNILVEK